MDTKFKFELGQKVKLSNGAEAEVQSNSISRGMSVNRVDVEYFDNNGEKHSAWFDEDQLEAVE